MIKKLLADGERVDGRHSLDYRNISVRFPYYTKNAKSGGKCIVSFGKTRVLATVTSEIVEPKPKYPSRGILNLNINSNMIKDENKRIRSVTQSALLFYNQIKDFLRDGIDLDSLCICAKERVFSISVNVKIENDDGNVLDCVIFAAVMALKTFKRPDVSVDTNGHIIVHEDIEKHDPVPLGLNALPIFVTFCTDNISKGSIILDCTREEEDMLDCHVLAMMTENGNCRYAWPLGSELWWSDPEFLENCFELIREKVFRLKTFLNEAVKVHDSRKEVVIINSQSYLPTHKSFLNSKSKKKEVQVINAAPEVGDDMDIDSNDEECIDD